MNSATDLGRIKRNVARMVDLGAPEEEIDSYIAGEGTTVDAVRSYVPAPEEGALSRFGKGVVEGVGQAGLGVYQVAANLVSPPDIFDVGGPAPGDTLNDDGTATTGAVRRVAESVDRRATEAIDESRQRVDKLGTAGKVGQVTGQVAGSLPFTPAARAAAAGKPTIAGAGGLGAASGAMAPVGSEDSRIENTVVGGVAGGAVQAVPSAVSGVRRVAGNVTGVDDTAARELADQGFTVSALTAGKGNSGGEFVRGYLRNTFIGGRMVEGVGKRAAQQADRAADKAISDVGASLDAAGAGEKLIGGLDASKRAFQSEASRLYDEAESLIPRGFVRVDNLKAMLSGTDDKLQGLKLGKVLRDQPTGQLADDFAAALAEAQGKGRVDFDMLKAIRTRVGEQVDGAAFGSPDQRFWRRAYAALSRDMESAARGGGDAAVDVMKAANNFYRTGRAELEKQIRRFGGTKEVEDAFKAIASPDTLRNAPQRVEQLFQRLPQANRKVVGATLIRRLGQKVDGGEFDPLTFATKWEAIAPRARQAIANGADNAAQLDQLVRNIRRVQPAVEAIPATDQVAAGRSSDIAAAISAIYAPWLSIAKFSMDAGLGWLLTRPQNIKLLNTSLEKGNPQILQRAVRAMSAMDIPEKGVREQFNALAEQVGTVAAAGKQARKPKIAPRPRNK